MMLSKVRGEFQDFAIDLDLDEEHPEAATVEARVKTASVDTRDVLRDGHLRSPDFFKSDEYPEMVFKSTRVVRTGKTKAKLHGDLTIRDVTKPVVLDVTYLGSSKSPSGHDQSGFRGQHQDQPRGLGSHLECGRGDRRLAGRQGHHDPYRGGVHQAGRNNLIRTTQ